MSTDRSVQSEDLRYETWNNSEYVLAQTATGINLANSTIRKTSVNETNMSD